MVFAMSSWEASNHSQTHSPLFAELPCDKRSCDQQVGPGAEAGEQPGWLLLRQGTESGELPVPPPALGMG